MSDMINNCSSAKGEASSYAFVTYALPEDTDTAAAELKDATIRGNQLNVSVSNRKQKQSKHGRDGPDQKDASEDAQKPAKKPAKKKQKTESGAAVEVTPKGSPPKKRKTDAKEDGHATTASKKGRLIVRNLSFKVSYIQSWCAYVLYISGIFFSICSFIHSFSHSFIHSFTFRPLIFFIHIHAIHSLILQISIFFVSESHTLRY